MLSETTLIGGVLDHMKISWKIVVCLVAAFTLLTGCCTVGRVTQWEYKSTYPHAFVGAPSDLSAKRKHMDSFLNEQGSQAWILVQKESDGLYIFKRPKR